jgi:phosphoglycerate dehydrogenase-like enzyme
MAERRRALLLAVLLLPFPAAATDPPAPVDPVTTALISDFGLRAAPVASRELPGWRRPRRVLVRALAPEQLAFLQAVAPGVELVPAATPAEAARLAGSVDAALGFCEPEVLAAGRRLRWIQLYTAGAGPCAAEPLVRERGLVVTNMQRISGPEIAEHVMAMLLVLNRGFLTWLPQQQRAEWRPGAVPLPRLRELRGRTLLVVGLGGIGTEVARRASGFGMRVTATRASAAPKPDFVAYVGAPAELDNLASQADVVVNCTPLLPATTALFDDDFFRAMKPGGYFINVGRGQSVVQADLVAALKDGRLAGAGLDVTDPEPLPADDPLWTAPNVVITPHVSAGSDRVFDRVFLLARENLRRWTAGEPLLSVVDVGRGY